MKLFRYLMPAALALVAAGCVTTEPSPSEEGKEFAGLYKLNALELADMVDNGKSPDQIAEQARKLISLAEPVVQSYAASNPECKPYLNKTLSDAQSMQELSLAEIEKQYLKGEALPKAPTKCEEAKDLVVHPAAVIILAHNEANPDVRTRIKSEINRVLHGLDTVRAQF